MSFFHSPRIVTDGLRLYVDAANPRCYPGSGTDLDDLVDSSISGSMSGVTFNTNNLGTFNFGTDDVIDMGLPSNLQSMPGSVFSWIYPISFGDNSFARIVNFRSTDGYLLFLDNSSVTNGFSFNTSSPTRAANTITLNTWQYVGITFDDTQSLGSKLKMFVNGSEVTISVNGNTDDATFVTTGNYYIGNRAALDRDFRGEIAIVMEYNRPLTEQEVLQNFNALRGRFGI